MPEVIVGGETCGQCGVDVRESTAFCYNCGSKVAAKNFEDVPVPASLVNGKEESVDRETQAALDDLAKKFKIDEEADDQLAKAAAERRKARVTHRRNVQYVWQPQDDSSNRLFIRLTLLITAIVAAVVFLTVLWR